MPKEQPKVNHPGMPAVIQGDHELAVARQSTEVAAEVQASIILARKFPRDLKMVFQNMTATCERPAFAALAQYKYPRGGSQVEGPSVNLARELQKLYQNMRAGLTVLSESHDNVKIQGWAWDMESNVRMSFEDSFAKKVFRKGKGWISVAEDER